MYLSFNVWTRPMSKLNMATKSFIFEWINFEHHSFAVKPFNQFNKIPFEPFFKQQYKGFYYDVTGRNWWTLHTKMTTIVTIIQRIFFFHTGTLSISFTAYLNPFVNWFSRNHIFATCIECNPIFNWYLFYLSHNIQLN